MPIPKEILAVERPVNTVVFAYGKNKNLYAVKQRIGCKYKDGGRYPVTGPTIGHIVNNKFVPCPDISPMASVSDVAIDLKDWANIELCNVLFKDMLIDLLKYYNRSDAEKLYCIALLRVCYPAIKDCELRQKYLESFLSELYPGVGLSKNTVSTFFMDVGRTCSRIVGFMRERVGRISDDDHVLIDGTLKSNESKINTLSDFSRKAQLKGSKDISVLYAFDLEKMEPVCSKCFPGNMLDQSAYENFIAEFQLTRGIIVADKGFPASSANQYFATHRDLHFLNPIKRNSKIIEQEKLYEYEGILDNKEIQVTYKKLRSETEQKYYYSFRDLYRAGLEERDWILRQQSQKAFSYRDYEQKKMSFGTVVLESDIDLAPEIAYKAYEDRWQIELVMRFYKHACFFDETRVHSDYSVIGTEFCDFLAVLLTYRLLKKFDSIGILKLMTYKKVMAILRRAKKVKLPGEKSWSLIKMLVKQQQILQALGLTPKPSSLGATKTTPTVSAPPIMKRARGRPRKNV